MALPHYDRNPLNYESRGSGKYAMRPGALDPDYTPGKVHIIIISKQSVIGVYSASKEYMRKPPTALFGFFGIMKTSRVRQNLVVEVKRLGAKEQITTSARLPRTMCVFVGPAPGPGYFIQQVAMRNAIWRYIKE